jgi:hypothetical protein
LKVPLRTIFSARIQNRIAAFLERLSLGAPPEKILLVLWEEVEGILLDESGDAPAGLRVFWEDGCRRCFGAGQETPGGPPTALSEAMIAETLRRCAAVPEAHFEYPPLKVVTLHCDGMHTIGIAMEGRGERLWIVCAAPAEKGPPLEWKFLIEDISGLKSLFASVSALSQASAAALRARDVDRAVHNRTRDINSRLREAADLVEDLCREGSVEIDLLAKLMISVVQALLGTGWTTRPVGPDQTNDETALFQRILDRLRGALASGETTAEAESRALLRAVTDTLCALVHQPPTRRPLETPLPGLEATVLLPLWTRMHDVMRPEGGGEPAETDQLKKEWQEAVAATLPLLARHLAVAPRPPRDEPSRASPPRAQPARNWLFLWLAFGILREEQGFSIGWGEGCRLRAELAYVLREGLRHACFGNRPDYFFQAATFAKALAKLVLCHSLHVIGIEDQFKLNEILDLIGSDAGLNRLSAADHLQHVLEIYIGAHFLFSVEVKIGAAESFQLGESLYRRDLPKAIPEDVAAGRRALGLAALAHDIGVLLFPREARPVLTMWQPQGDLEEGIASVDGTVAEAGRALSERCLKLPDEYFPENRDDAKRVKQAFIAQAKAGRPNHGLLGAWFLHCAFMEAKGRRPSQPEGVWRQAIRAILLHDATAASISEGDPVAALLLLCNEIFEWDPRRHVGPAPSAIGGRGHIMAGDVRPREPRDRALRIKDLVVEVVDRDGRPDLSPVIYVRGSGDPWPEIQMDLQAPENLDVPVYRLWLSKAQNIGRLRGPREGWRPALLLRARTREGRGTYALLQEIVDGKTLPHVAGSNVKLLLGRRDRLAVHGAYEIVTLAELDTFFEDRGELDWLDEVQEAVERHLARR